MGTQTHCHAMWEAVILDLQYAIRLDNFITRTRDWPLLHLVNILRAADNLDIAAKELQNSPGAKYSAISIRYPRRLIKRSVMLLLESRNFGDICNRMQAELAWTPPPDDLEVVERSPTPFVPTPPESEPEDDETKEQIDSDALLALALAVAPPSPPTNTEDTLIASQQDIALMRSYSPSDDLYVPDPSYVPTSLIDRIDLDATPIPVPEPLPTPSPITRSSRSRGKKRARATSLLSMGLPLSQVHRKRLSYDEPTDSLQVDTLESIRFAQFEASQTTQEAYANYVCNICHVTGHKFRHCNRYFCRICGQFAPGHITTECRLLNGRKLLRRGRSDPNFFAQLRKLEAAFDQAAAVKEQNRELNALEAEDWLADVDVDPCYYDNMDN